MGAPKKPRAKKAAEPKTMKEAAAMANAPKGQQRIAVDSRDVQRIHASHEVPRPMSDAEFMLTASQAAQAQAEAETIDSEIQAFVNEKRVNPQGVELPSRKDAAKAARKLSHKLLREVKAKAHLVVTPCIEVHDLNRGVVTIYLDDNGVEGEKVKERRMTDVERKKAQEAAPFAPPTGEPVELDEDTKHGSVLDDRETEEERQGGLPFGSGDDDDPPESHERGDGP